MYGLDLTRELREHEETDYVFGAASKSCIALIPQDKRAACLPKGEVQRGKEDWMDCASRAPVNKLEAKFTYIYQQKQLTIDQKHFLERNDYLNNGRVTFSDRFIAIKSGTTRDGNSLKAPCDAIHRYGLIPKNMLPAKRSMSFSDYHNPKSITRKMEKLGQEFLALFPITYERVREEDYASLIEEDMIIVAGYAWPDPVDGVYPKTDRSPNHAFLFFDIPRFTIFDNYEEGKGDFVKQLAPNYDLVSFGYRVFIGEPSNKTSLMAQLIADCERLIALLRNRLGSWLG